MSQFIRDNEDPVFWVQYRHAPDLRRAALSRTRSTGLVNYLPDFRDLLTILKGGLPRVYTRPANSNEVPKAIFIIQSLTDANRSWARDHGRLNFPNDVTPQDIVAGLERLVQSGAENTSFKFGFAFEPSPRVLRIRGRGKTRMPSYINSRYKLTWEEQKFNNEPINCGALAIAYQLIARPSTFFGNTLRKAKALMEQFNWKEETTGEQLSQFVLGTDYRLTIIFAATSCYIGQTWQGSRYILDTLENTSKLTPECKKKTLYIVWDPVSDHFGCVQTPQTPYAVSQKHSKNWKFCHACVTCFNLDNPCNCGKPVEKKLVIKTCKFCQKTPCVKPCKRSCQLCGSIYNTGYDVSRGEGHRCIVYSNSTPKEFSVDEHPKNYMLWAYDIEACTKVIEKTAQSFLKENNQFVMQDGEFVIFDRQMEIQQTNMVVFRNVFDPNSEQVLFGENSLQQFVEYMLTVNDGRNICIAHNGSGYDTRLVCEEINKFKKNIRTSTTANGTKMMELIADKTIFRDSLLFLPGSLSSLAKAFELPTKKGTFPHLFNSIDNYDYEGCIPDKKYFDSTFTAKTEKDITDFDAWYEERSKTPWNFMHELTTYCKDDVKILADLILKYHEICTEKFKFSPWFHSTAPSHMHATTKNLVCNDDVLGIPDKEDVEGRSRRIEKLAWDEHWAILLPQEYWHARRALIGGRTDVRRIQYRLSEEDIANGLQIKYQDIVSMYPYVQARKLLEYPVGLPRIKVYDSKFYPCTKHQSPERGNKLEICDCPRNLKFTDRLIDVEEIHQQPSLEYMMDYNTFGIATVSMQPPTNLFHPVLVVWNEKTGKREATLERIVEQTFTMIEIQRALDKGYKLLKVHRIDLYNKREGLWADFVKKLYIEKLANSDSIPSPEEQERLVAAYEEDFGIGEDVRESFPRWGYRGALRLVFKIMLNSGW